MAGRSISDRTALGAILSAIVAGLSLFTLPACGASIDAEMQARYDAILARRYICLPSPRAAATAWRRFNAKLPAAKSLPPPESSIAQQRLRADFVDAMLPRCTLAQRAGPDVLNADAVLGRVHCLRDWNADPTRITLCAWTRHGDYQ